MEKDKYDGAPEVQQDDDAERNTSIVPEPRNRLMAFYARKFGRISYFDRELKLINSQIHGPKSSLSA